MVSRRTTIDECSLSVLLKFCLIIIDTYYDLLTLYDLEVVSNGGNSWMTVFNLYIPRGYEVVTGRKC
jgi:hypothetical protein